MIPKIFKEVSDKKFHELIKRAQQIFGEEHIRYMEYTRNDSRHHYRKYYYVNDEQCIWFTLGYRDNETHRKMFVCNIEDILRDYNGEKDKMAIQYSKNEKLLCVKDHFFVNGYGGTNELKACKVMQRPKR